MKSSIAAPFLQELGFDDDVERSLGARDRRVTLRAVPTGTVDLSTITV
jgi:hypothetical protein